MYENGTDKSEYMLTIERDMRPKAFLKEDPFSSKIFKNYPLIGDYIISDESLEKMHSNVKKYIDQAMLPGEKAKYKNWVYEQVAIVVVNYAKKWNSFEEGKFSRYIAMQFGYKDDSGKVWRIISEALDIAFNRNGRFFIKSSNGDRQFYETVMSHSYGPANAWDPLLELLFSFYTNNLDWNYVPGDPLFARFVRALQKHFNNETTTDDKFLIASQYYYLRIGIRRLVQERPGYCVNLFEMLVKRMHQLLLNEAGDAKRYAYQLVDNWFVNRISQAIPTEEKKKQERKEPLELALDYSKISVKYVLQNGLPALRIPSIRVMDESTGFATVSVYLGSDKVASYDLDIHGNELGETIRGKVVPLPLTTKGTPELNYRVTIQRGSEILYDSENSLNRSLLVFSDSKEVSPAKIRREKYIVYARNINKLIGKNVDIVPYVNGMCEMAFHKNYSLEYMGNTIAIDSADIQGIRLVKPAISEDAVFELMGEEYLVAKTSASLKVYYSDRKVLQRYSVRIDDKQYQLSEFDDTMSGNRAVIPLIGSTTQTVELSLVDIAAGSIVFHQKYIIFSSFKVVFDKEYYTLADQYAEINATVSIDGKEFILQGQAGSDLIFNYENGCFIFAVPSVDYHFYGIDYIYLNKYVRSDELKHDSVLKISNATGMMHTIIIGDNVYPGENTIDLSHYANSSIIAQKSTPIFIEIAGNKTRIAEILYHDTFVKAPNLVVKENVLLWDGGESYVGKKNEQIELVLSQNGKELYRFGLQFGVQKIASLEQSSFVDGVYQCAFFKNGLLLNSQSVFLGDERKARFSEKIIQIDQVTEDIESSSTAVTVKTIYIDQIKYVDTCYVDTEDDVFDVYTGCMYWVNYYGEKKYLSFKYNEKKGKYKVNPVKIIYISNRYLRIVNEDDEGIYYFNNEYSSAPGYEITDIEPVKSARGYHDILFYLYSTISTKKTEQVSTVSPVQVTTDILTVNKSYDKVRSADSPVSKEGNLFENLQETTQEMILKLPVDARTLINAGPGTGKTWTLIERIIRLIQDEVDPESIQVLCFSRAAVEVVRSRMEEAIRFERVDIDANKVDIRTFDSFCTQLLYWVKESDYKELSSNYNIELLSYDERIKRFTEIIKAQPQLIEQCEHLIVDEVQDLVLSRAEMVLELITQLPPSSGVTLFGDACQAIYDYQVESGMSSTDFYAAIQALNQFEFFSFTQNYRQTSKLQDYCADYRKAILENDLEKCAQQLAVIFEDLPDYDVTELKHFSEDSLEKLTCTGNVGILTRSNAQALMISALFRKKNIAHTIQRRLSDDSLSGWIGMLFNSSPLKYYDEESFVAMFSALCSEYQGFVDSADVWNQISGTNPSMSGKLSSKALMLAIKNRGRCKGLYSEAVQEAVTISTIHRSKGREYDSVLILNSLLSETAKESEEQRVNYVALSRAKSRMYKVDLSNAYFRTLENRRCYSVGTSFKSGSHYLRYFEIGRTDDLLRPSFCAIDGVQKTIKTVGRALIGKEVFLRKDKLMRDGTISYAVILRETEQILAYTSKNFSDDLSSAIRQIKNLPRYAAIYENLFPAAFSGIYITDIASEIGMVQGLEKDVVEHEGFVAWNTLLIEGYSKAEY